MYVCMYVCIHMCNMFVDNLGTPVEFRYLKPKPECDLNSMRVSKPRPNPNPDQNKFNPNLTFR